MQTTPQKFSIRKRLQSFVFAYRGLKYFFITQHNAWIHSILTLLAIFLGFYCNISSTEWAILCLTIAWVFSLEILNTALESVVDWISKDHHPLAGLSKDLAAGAVLCASIFAVFVGIFIFLPKLFTLFF